MSARDLRWKLAFWVWCPAAWIEARIHLERSPRVLEIENDVARLLAGLEALPGYTEAELPRYQRALRRFVVDPLTWLSDRIYPDTPQPDSEGEDDGA